MYMFALNIGELMKHRAYLSPEEEGFIGRERYSFNDMNRRVNQFSNYLLEQQIRQGERIALICKNHEDFITAFFGAAKLGIITVPINWRLGVEELNYIISDCQPSLVLFDKEFSEKINNVELDSSIQMLEVVTTSFDQLLQSYRDEEPDYISTNGNTILIMYTSGTTGKPKGAMITHQNLFAASVGMSHVIDWWAQDRFLSVAPFFHIGGFAPIITNLHNGSTSILMADFDPIAAWNIIEKEKITTMMTIPVMLQFMLKVLDKVKPDYSSVRNITCGASAVSPSLIQAYDDLGITIQQVYGITEYTGAISFWKKSMDKEKVTSMGKSVFHGNVKVVDMATKQPLGVNQVGELVCSGPQVFKGYWKNEKETKKVLQDNEYFTGDIGRMDEEGFIYVVDRLKDMIISGGENIYPAELEAVVQSHPEVVEVAVLGEPDEKWGEIPKAYVVLSRDSTLTEEAIIQLCRESLASYKSIKKVEFIDVLPRNGAGKVLKHELKEISKAGS